MFPVLYSRFSLVIYFINLFIYLFIFGCVGSSLLHTGFLQLRRAGSTLRCGAQASHCGGFSCCGARALGMWASVVVACGLTSCGSWTQLLRGRWDLPGPGLKPVSPALAGGFLTTVLPGKPQLSILHILVYVCQSQSPNSSHPCLSPVGIHMFVLYICVSISALQAGSSVPFFQIPHICVNI